MKRWLAGAMIVCSAGAGAEPNYLTEKAAPTGRQIALIGQGCARLFTVHRVYGVEKTPGVSYRRKILQDGARELAEPVAEIRVSLVPQSAAIDADDERKIRDWARQASASCAGRSPALEPYPTQLLKLSAQGVLGRAGIKLTDARLAPGGRIEMVMEFNPAISGLEDVVKTLARHRPVLQIKTFDLGFEAYAKIDVDYAALANFANHHYTERVCYSGERCFRVLGLKVRCEGYHYCNDIPRMTTELKNLNYAAKAKLEVAKAEDVPERKLNVLLDELMSRFMLSSFHETSRKIVGDITQVTLGQLAKTGANRYNDEMRTDRLIEKDIDQPLLWSTDLSVLENDVRAVFALPEIQCLKREAARSPVPVNHQCFRN